MHPSIHLLLLAASLLLAGQRCTAQKYNLLGYIQSPLVQTHNSPGDDCDVAGVCTPVNQTVPARTLWYWCGFWTTHRTIYTITSNNPKVNLTAQFLMRQNELESCALPNVSWISDRCLSIPESSCSGRRTCNVRVFGLVFPDPACLVIINNNKDNDVIVTVQAQNFFDSPRYYGTVFVLFFTIVGGMAILANVAYQFYTIIVAPVGKHQEQIKIKRDEPTDPERAAGGGASGGGGGSAAGGAGSSANGGGVNGVSGPSPLRPAAMVGKLVDKIKDGLKRGGGDDDKRQA